jgi:hypothetical protein
MPGNSGEKKTALRRSASAKKSASGGRKKVSDKADLATTPKARAPIDQTDEEIRMLAYFISERRHRLGLPGDSNSDWLEAKRQLVSESEKLKG